ncbi:hypothetical protein ANTPLA_LOCUS4542 [Anthophora plagiata]
MIPFAQNVHQTRTCSVTVMSVQFQPFMAAHHHGGGVGCYGRRPRPNDGNAEDTDGGNNNNGQTNGDGQNGETEQI